MNLADEILIIEDDDDIRTVYAATLQMAGYRVVAVADGEAALRHLRETSAPPRLILLDLMMPGMNGWQFRAEQRKSATLEAIPVVVISAVVDQTWDEVPIAAAAYLRKPFDIDTLLAVVSRVVQTPVAPAGGLSARDRTAP